MTVLTKCCFVWKEQFQSCIGEQLITSQLQYGCKKPILRFHLSAMLSPQIPCKFVKVGMWMLTVGFTCPTWQTGDRGVTTSSDVCKWCATCLVKSLLFIQSQHLFDRLLNLIHHTLHSMVHRTPHTPLKDLPLLPTNLPSRHRHHIQQWILKGPRILPRCVQGTHPMEDTHQSHLTPEAWHLRVLIHRSHLKSMHRSKKSRRSMKTW